MHPELVCRLFALSSVSGCVELSGRSQIVTVSERPERDFCNTEDLRTADDTSSHLDGCTGEHVPSPWFVVGQLYRCRPVLSLQKVLVKIRAVPEHATGLE